MTVYDLIKKYENRLECLDPTDHNYRLIGEVVNDLRRLNDTLKINTDWATWNK